VTVVLFTSNTSHNTVKCSMSGNMLLYPSMRINIWMHSKNVSTPKLSPLFLIFSYRGADKSLARPWKETSYSDQDIQHYTKIYGVQTTGILLFVRHKSWYSVVCLGRCSLFPSRVGIKNYQHPCIFQ